MKQRVDKVMETFGTDMTIHRSVGSEAVRGFFRAANSAGWKSIETMVTELGEITRGQFVYLGPAAVELNEGETLEVLGRKYCVRRAQPYVYRGGVLYYWGLCVEEGENDTWATQS